MDYDDTFHLLNDTPTLSSASPAVGSWAAIVKDKKSGSTDELLGKKGGRRQDTTTHPTSTRATEKKVGGTDVTRSTSTRSEKQISKTLSYILRHGARELGLKIDGEGRVALSELLGLRQLSGVTEDDVAQIVANNDKQRFEMKRVGGNMTIRANQGHSKGVGEMLNDDAMLTEITSPLQKCIHGTYRKAWDTIKSEGLNVMGRKHIHFAIGEPGETNVISGMRGSAEILIYIDMGLAMADDIKFYMSANNVVLSSGLDGVLLPKYFAKVVHK